ncbi:hypothetical protein FKM82_002590 [Ascaphus truei]
MFYPRPHGFSERRPSAGNERETMKEKRPRSWGWVNDAHAFLSVYDSTCFVSLLIPFTQQVVPLAFSPYLLCPCFSCCDLFEQIHYQVSRKLQQLPNLMVDGRGNVTQGPPPPRGINLIA